jgi:hypothetical protein
VGAVGARVAADVIVVVTGDEFFTRDGFEATPAELVNRQN